MRDLGTIALTVVPAIDDESVAISCVEFFVFFSRISANGAAGFQSAEACPLQRVMNHLLVKCIKWYLLQAGAIQHLKGASKDIK